MTIKGLLPVGEITTPIPVTTPPFGTGDQHFVDVDWLRFQYVTDGATAARCVPDVFELEEKPKAHVSFNYWGYSTVGCYLEVVQGVECSFRGQKFFYPVRLYLNNDVAMLAGREAFGIPKLAAHIVFDTSAQGPILSGRVERPEGIPLATGVMQPHEYLGTPSDIQISSWGLRVIPNVQGQQPALRQLVNYRMWFSGGTMWRGNGLVTLTGASSIDTFQDLPVLSMSETIFMRKTQVRMQMGECIDLR